MRHITAIAGVWLMAMAVSACDTTPDRDVNDADDSVLTDIDRDIDDTAGTTGSMPRVADIVSEPQRFAGQTVTLTADVDEVLGPMAFTLDEDSPLAGGIDSDLLVLSRKAGTLETFDDQWTDNKVRVTGTVGKMTVVDVERELGWDLTPELEVEFEGTEAVLIADSVTRVED